jgi:hypothetical protein
LEERLAVQGIRNRDAGLGQRPPTLDCEKKQGRGGGREGGRVGRREGRREGGLLEASHRFIFPQCIYASLVIEGLNVLFPKNLSSHASCPLYLTLP